MSRFFSNIFVLMLCRFILAGVFLAAAVPKILDPAAFAIAVDNYHFLPTFLVNFWALVLPWVELLVGVVLLLGPAADPPLDKLTEASALLSALMYLSFIIALSAALARDLDIACGCFDPKSAGSIDVFYLLRDSSLLLASLVVLFFHHRLAAGRSVK